MKTIQKKTREYNEQLQYMIKNPRWLIYYKGKEIKRYPFYRQAENYCRKHNLQCSKEKLFIVDAKTGEQTEYRDRQLTLF